MRTSKSGGALVRAARELFLESGYDGVSLDAVAARAGYSRQTVYNRFGNKEALFRATVEEQWSFFKLEQVFGAPAFDPSSTDPETLLKQIGELIVRFLHSTDQIMFTRLVISESRRWPAIGEEFYRLGKAPALAALVGKLRQMVDVGQLECTDPELAARQFLGLIQEFLIWPHVMAIGAPAQDLPSSDVVIEEAAAMMLSRYGVRPPRTRRVADRKQR